jgi:hypothetical protein
MATSIATPFAAAEQVLGASLVAAMANAVLTPTSGAGAGTPMPAVFSQSLVDGLGGQRLPGREPVALVPTAGLAADVQKDSTCTVLYLGATTSWRVQRRIDTLESGDTQLDLERPE